MSATYRCKVFERDGNRFLIPGIWHRADDPEGHTEALCNGLMFSAVLQASDDEWIDVEVDENGHADLEHVTGRFTGREFAHGSMDVLVLSGPMFDAAHRAKGEQ